MREALSSVLSVAPDDRVNLAFEDQKLVFRCSSDWGNASAGIDVIALTGAPTGSYNPFCGGPHFYNISMRHSFEAADFRGATRRIDRTADPADTRCDANCTIYHEAAALLKASAKK